MIRLTISIELISGWSAHSALLSCFFISSTLSCTVSSAEMSSPCTCTWCPNAAIRFHLSGLYSNIPPPRRETTPRLAMMAADWTVFCSTTLSWSSSSHVSVMSASISPFLIPARSQTSSVYSCAAAYFAAFQSAPYLSSIMSNTCVQRLFPNMLLVMCGISLTRCTVQVSMSPTTLPSFITIISGDESRSSMIASIHSLCSPISRRYPCLRFAAMDLLCSLSSPSLAVLMCAFRHCILMTGSFEIVTIAAGHPGVII